MNDIIEQLRERMKSVRPYPGEMVEIPSDSLGPIRGRSFFPAGDGLALGAGARFPRRPIMILGNDFDSFHGYESSVRDGEEPDQGTWSGLIQVLREAGVGVDDCFFTNAFMGAKKSASNTGKSPWLFRHNKSSLPRCADYLRTQVEVVKPRSLIMIGKEQVMVVGMAFPVLAEFGRKAKWTWPEIDSTGLQFVASVSHPASNATPPFAFCAVMHPCMRASNLGQTGRTYVDQYNETHRDAEAENLMIRLCRDA